MLFRKLLIFSPIYLLVTFLIVIFLVNGETMSYEKVSKNQDIDNVIYGPAYSNIRNYKLFKTYQNQYQFVILGTSRVMQMRPMDISHDGYNAGGAISRIEHLLPYTEHLVKTNLKPDYIIVGLDHYFFNEEWSQVEISERSTFKRQIALLQTRPNPSIREFSKDLLFSKGFINDLFNPKYPTNIGLNARVNGTGFRIDGSLIYGNYVIQDSVNKVDFSDSLERIELGNSRFEYSSEINDDAINELIVFLEYAEINEIEVYAFLPPYAPTVYQEMLNTGNYDYIINLPSKLELVFSEYNNHSFFDYTNMVNFDDTFFVDGFHGDDRIYLEISEKFKELIN